MLTMHPHVTGHRSRMKYLEELVVYIKSKPGVWFGTGEEIASIAAFSCSIETGVSSNAIVLNPFNR